MSDATERGEQRRTGMLGRRKSDNFDNHMLWLKTEYIDPTVDATLEKAQQIWTGIVRAEIAKAASARSKRDQDLDNARDWRTVRISTGVAFLVSAGSWIVLKLKGWL